MFSIRTGLFSLACFFWSISVLAQIPNEPANIQSPNAMSFGMFGDIPVSYYSGLPSIQVPLYSFKENGITVPISLNYHAAGFRPDVHPGWVGFNWNLTAGGVITRTVRDIRDDFGLVLPQHSGYYITHGINSAANWETETNLRQIVTSSYNSDGDNEPDEFSFTFPGYSGKFYMDHLGKWKVACDKPVKVEFDGVMIPAVLKDTSDILDLYSDGYYSHFSGFTIIDEFGNKYVFGKDPAAIEFGTSFFAAGPDMIIAQAWYLTRIIHADGYEVNLKYERDDYINQMYSAYYRAPGFYHEGGPLGGDDGCLNEGGGSSTLESSYSGKIISPVYLSSIEGSSETIRFKRSTTTELKYSTTPGDYHNPYDYRESELAFEYPNQRPQLARILQWPPGSTYPSDFYPSLAKLKFKQLDTIEVYDKLGIPIRKFKLYFTASTSKRLALDSLREIGKDGQLKPPYRFAYKSYGSGEPPYFDNKTDHYGFYNGAYTDGPDIDTYFDYRNAHNATYAQYGIIDSITYPTGGITKFQFEPNTYYKRVQESATRGIDNGFAQNTNSGGLRIRKIESYDKTTPSVKKKKEYFYVSNYSSSTNTTTAPSSGVLGFRSKYFFGDVILPVWGGHPDSYYLRTTISSQSVLPACENSAGTHIGYGEVTEVSGDGSYTRYFYNNYENEHLDDSAIVVQKRTFYERVSSKAVQRGTLKRQEEYSNANILLRKKTIEYIALNKAKEVARGIEGGIFRVCPTDGGSFAQAYSGVAYKTYTYSYLPKSEVLVEYSQNGADSLVSKKYLFYNDSTKLIIKDSLVDSKGLPVCNYYYYPTEVLNYSPVNNAPISQTMAYMKQKNMIGNLIQTISTKKIGGAELITDLSLTTYRTFGSLIKPFKHYRFLQPTTQVVKGTVHLYKVNYSLNVENEVLPANTDLLANYTKYDLRGNVTTLAKEQDNNIAYLWGNDFQFPVAKVSNAYNNLEYNYTPNTKTIIVKQPERQYFTTTTFKNYQQGTIKLNFAWDATPPAGAVARIDVIFRGPTNDFFIMEAGKSDSIVNAPAGIYSVYIYCEATIPLVSASLRITHKGEQANQTSYNTASQFFYEGFEDSEFSSVKPFAGNNCKSGDYTVPYVVPSGGVYYIDYRYLSSGKWEYTRKWYSNNMTITDGDAIDEVRVYRTDAQINTYTYDVNNGMTSETDWNGNSRFYHYDGLGRLAMIKDDKQNVLKRIGYTYYGQTPNYTLDTSALWQMTNITRCKPCPANPILYYSDTLQKMERNNNPLSADFNKIRWIDAGKSSNCAMTIPIDWQFTAAPIRCRTTGTGNNTGQREREQRNMNYCKPTDSVYRWIVIDTNLSVCPPMMTNIVLINNAGWPGGYITLSGDTGPYTYSLSGFSAGGILGTIPGGFYDIKLDLTTSLPGIHSWTVGGMTISGSGVLTLYDRPVGGPNFNIIANY